MTNPDPHAVLREHLAELRLAQIVEIYQEVLNEAARKIIFAPKPLVRDNSRSTRKQQQALERLELRIQEKEQAMRRLNKALQKSGNGQSYERVHQLSQEFAQAQSEMEDLMTEWETLVV